MLTELIARLERADEGTALLDMHIALSLGTTQPDCSHPYTRSVDAALQLMPKGGRLLELGQWGEHGQPGRWFAQVCRWHRDGENDWREQGYAVGVEHPEDACATAALALCIAALKARASS